MDQLLDDCLICRGQRRDHRRQPRTVETAGRGRSATSAGRAPPFPRLPLAHTLPAIVVRSTSAIAANCKIGVEAEAAARIARRPIFRLGRMNCWAATMELRSPSRCRCPHRSQPVREAQPANPRAWGRNPTWLASECRRRRQLCRHRRPGSPRAQDPSQHTPRKFWRFDCWQSEQPPAAVRPLSKEPHIQRDRMQREQGFPLAKACLSSFRSFLSRSL